MAATPTNPKTARPKAAGPKAAGPKAAGRPRAAKARAAKAAAAPQEGAAPETAAKAATGLRLKDLVDKVAAGSDVKKKDVRTVVEAALVQMGEALKRGENLNLVGLGRIRVAKAGDAGGAMTLKLRMGGPAAKGEKADAEPLADAEDQD